MRSSRPGRIPPTPAGSCSTWPCTTTTPHAGSLGQRPVRVFAERQALVHRQLLEVGDLDNAIVTVSFDGGGLATSHISRTCAFGHDIRAEIMGSEGSIFVGNGAEGAGVTVLDASSEDRVPARLPGPLPRCFPGGDRRLRRRLRRRRRGRRRVSDWPSASGGPPRSRTIAGRWRPGVAARASAVQDVR